MDLYRVIASFVYFSGVLHPLYFGSLIFVALESLFVVSLAAWYVADLDEVAFLVVDMALGLAVGFLQRKMLMRGAARMRKASLLGLLEYQVFQALAFEAFFLLSVVVGETQFPIGLSLFTLVVLAVAFAFSLFDNWRSISIVFACTAIGVAFAQTLIQLPRTAVNALVFDFAIALTFAAALKRA